MKDFIKAKTKKKLLKEKFKPKIIGGIYNDGWEIALGTMI
jgi:hypothetical protein